MNKNEIIDECINKIKGLIRPHCRDHSSSWGTCSSCGRYDDYDELPEPDDVIEALENLKENNE